MKKTISQVVDPIVTEAIEKAVEKEGWVLWSSTDDDVGYTPLPEPPQWPRTSVWGLISGIL